MRKFCLSCEPSKHLKGGLNAKKGTWPLRKPPKMALGVFLFSDNLTENKAPADLLVLPFEAHLSNWTPDGRFVETEFRHSLPSLATRGPLTSSPVDTVETRTSFLPCETFYMLLTLGKCNFYLPPPFSHKNRRCVLSRTNILKSCFSYMIVYYASLTVRDICYLNVLGVSFITVVDHP